MTKKQKGKNSKKRKLTKKVLKTLTKINNLEKRGVKLAIKAGLHLSKLQEIAKNEGDSWEEYVKKHFGISIRTVQRYIKIAQRVDIKDHPALISLSQTLILELITVFPEEDNIGNFLRNDMEIKTDINLDDDKEVKLFRCKIDEMLFSDDDDDDDDDIDADDIDDDQEEEEDDYEDDDDDDEDDDEDDEDEEDEEDEDDDYDQDDDDDDQDEESIKDAKKRPKKDVPKNFQKQYKSAFQNIINYIGTLKKKKDKILRPEIGELEKYTESLEKELKDLKKMITNIKSN